MKIYFRTTKLERVFNSETRLYKKFGPQKGKIVKLRMAVLSEAETLAKIPHTKPYRRHLLSGEYEGMFSIDLKHPQRLIVKPANDPIPLKEDGGIDIDKVTEIEIFDVKDTHK